MSAHIVTYRDENNDALYPVTKTTAVLDDNNTDVETLLNNIKNYSTTETAIGVWIDGSTIYRKVFSYTESNNSNWTNIFDCSSLNIKAVIKIYGSAGDSYNWINLPVGEGQYYRNFRYDVSSKYIQSINNGFTGASGYIAIEYIKN